MRWRNNYGYNGKYGGLDRSSDCAGSAVVSPVSVPALHQNNRVDTGVLISMFDFAIWVWPARIGST